MMCNCVSSYRGIPAAHLAMVQQRYLDGSDVHWSAFNRCDAVTCVLRVCAFCHAPLISTTTSLDKAKDFAQAPVCDCVCALLCQAFGLCW